MSGTSGIDTMRTFGSILLALFLSLAGLTALRGQPVAVWHFGLHAGLRFDNGARAPVLGGQTNSWEGASMALDKTTGELLFYSDGRNVWDRDHRIMANGGGLSGGASSTQAALIVRAPANDSLYYLFTSANVEGNANISDGVKYSTIDMRLQGGKGGVLIRDAPLLKPATEKLTAVRHCNGRDYWVIAHQAASDVFHVWLLTPSGLSAAQQWSVGPIVSTGNASAGWLLPSPNGRLLAMALDVSPGEVWLFDFNASTGQVGNARDMGLDAGDYGVGFSPDGTKLYTSSTIRGRVWQFDLALPTHAQIVGSRTLLHSGSQIFEMGAFKIGPDGRLYVGRYDRAAISVIDSPNLGGISCRYRHGVVDLGGALGGLSLPNAPVEPRPGEPLSVSIVDTTICPGGSVRIHVQGLAPGTRLLWGPEAGLSCTDCPDPVAAPERTTTYTVILLDSGNCPRGADVRVAVRDSIRLSVSDTVICDGSGIRLRVGGIPPGSRVLWSPATGLSCADCPDPVALPTTDITYTIHVTDPGGCAAEARLHVAIGSPVLLSASDTTLCSGASAQLNVIGVPPGARIAWSPAAGLSCDDCANPTASPTGTTTYTMRATDVSGCSGQTQIRVVVVDTLRLRAHLPEEWAIHPGHARPVSLFLDESLDNRNATVLDVTTSADPGMMRVDSLAVEGSLCDGWQIVPISSSPEGGLYSARIIAPPGVSLSGTGELLRLHVLGYIRSSARSTLGVFVRSNASCAGLDVEGSTVSFDSVCGIEARLIALLPEGFGLDGSHANPVKRTATIGFSIPTEGHVTLSVVNGQGHRVDRLVNIVLPAGRHQVVWDATGVSSGYYMICIEQNGWVDSRPVVVIQ